MGVAPARVKIVVTVPESHVDVVRSTMGEAGGGVIGDYDHCSVTYPVVGRFRPNDSAQPFIGDIGKLETVEELQIEMQCDALVARKVIDAMCAVHPYEEVAYDIYALLSVEDL